MSDIKFRMAAKTDVGLERGNNEDNFQVSANLEDGSMRWVNNQEYSLGNKGALMVVADGMGGMNAGEVASEIAIDTVRELFAPEKITDEVVKTRFAIEKFMKGVVVEADRRIKKFAKEHPESKSMGTTIVIGWLFDGQLYVTWCGDSRAYIYNKETGLFQLSKDHSYVQQLVDNGKISKEDAFDFPDSNIITRSLSDATPKAVPDCLLKPQPLCNGDIIMLCSDGLNGMIRDNEIEAIMTQHQDNMTECVDALIHAALEAAGADNCTVALCQILSGGSKSEMSRIPKFNKEVRSSELKSDNTSDKNKKTLLWTSFITLLAIILTCIVVFLVKGNPFTKSDVPKEEIINDTIDNVKERDHKGEDILNENSEGGDFAGGNEVEEESLDKGEETTGKESTKVETTKMQENGGKTGKGRKGKGGKTNGQKTEPSLPFTLTPIENPNVETETEEEDEWEP